MLMKRAVFHAFNASPKVAAEIDKRKLFFLCAWKSNFALLAAYFGSVACEPFSCASYNTWVRMTGVKNNTDSYNTIATNACPSRVVETVNQLHAISCWVVFGEGWWVLFDKNRPKTMKQQKTTFFIVPVKRVAVMAMEANTHSSHYTLRTHVSDTQTHPPRKVLPPPCAINCAPLPGLRLKSVAWFIPSYKSLEFFDVYHGTVRGPGTWVFGAAKCVAAAWVLHGFVR